MYQSHLQCTFSITQLHSVVWIQKHLSFAASQQVLAYRLCVAFLICRIYGQSNKKYVSAFKKKMILRQKPVKPLLGQEIEPFWGKCRMLYEFACILVQVGSRFSESLQLSITHFPALLVFSSGPDYYSCTWFFHCYRKYLL